MTHIITIETQSNSDFAQIKGFAERLGLDFKESHAEGDLSGGYQEIAFKNLSVAGRAKKQRMNWKKLFMVPVTISRAILSYDLSTRHQYLYSSFQRATRFRTQH